MVKRTLCFGALLKYLATLEHKKVRTKYLRFGIEEDSIFATTLIFIRVQYTTRIITRQDIRDGTPFCVPPKIPNVH